MLPAPGGAGGNDGAPGSDGIRTTETMSGSGLPVCADHPFPARAEDRARALAATAPAALMRPGQERRRCN
jgi:hypothetical protein